MSDELATAPRSGIALLQPNVSDAAEFPLAAIHYAWGAVDGLPATDVAVTRALCKAFVAGTRAQTERIREIERYVERVEPAEGESTDARRDR